MSDYETALRLHRPHPFYIGLTDGPFVYRCFGCLAWRQKEAHEFCPDCAGTWQEIWEPPAEIRRAILEVRRKPTVRAPARPIPLVCAKPDCKRELPRGHRGPYCDFCSGC